MRIKYFVGISLLSLLTACSDSNQDQPSDTAGQEPEMKQASDIQPPVAKKVPFEMTAHGDTRIDNYYWMRDDERKDPEIIAHLEAENEYTKAQLLHTEDFQKQLFNEIVGRFVKDDDSVPFKRGDYYYYSRYEKDREYPIYARKKGSLEAEEEITLDVNKLAEGEDFITVTALRYHPNDKILAYAEDTLSRRIYTIHFKNLETGELLPDTLNEAEASAVWSKNGDYFFYIKKDLQTLLGNRVYRHKMGTSPEEDVLVYEEQDVSLYLGLSKSDDGNTIMIGRGNSTSASTLFLDANNPEGEFKLFQPHEEFIQYSITPIGDEFYYSTNRDAVNFQMFRINKADIDKPENWQLVIPHREDVLLSGGEVFDSHMVLIEKFQGINNVVIYDRDGKKLRDVEFNDVAYNTSLSANPEDDTNLVRVNYSSLTTPNSTIDINMDSGEQTVLKQTKVLGDFNPDLYKSERIMVEARDGKMVPVSIVYRVDRFKKDGTNPLYLYAYGSYGASMTPTFRSTRLTLLDRGFVYAIAHIRGSSTLGRQWYEDGKLLNKKNTFYDYIDVTKALVEQGYGAPDKVIGAGGSAGGLLMGAVANMAPELYFGLSAYVPWVDVVTTMSDPSIPLTTNEYTEWGNPADKEYYEYMLSYSPYDNIKAQDYPNLFVHTGLHDSQVQYFEPAKWVAKLRELKTDNNKLLFDVNLDSGHGGASGRFKRYELMAMEFAFYFDMLGINE